MYTLQQGAGKWYCKGFDIFTAVNMKNVVFWDIKTQFVPHRRHISLRYRAQPANAM
jgi:hypothetical protein